METSMRKNTVYNTVKTISSVLYPLIAFVYVSRVLMPENLGKVNFGNSIISYFSLIATLGISTYAIRECSKVRNNKEKLGELASQLFSINLLSTVFSYMVLAVVLLFSSKLGNYRELICIQSTVILFATLGADWLNTAMEDFRFITLRTIFMQVVSLVLIFLFVRKPEDYLVYALITVLANSGANVVNIFYRRKFCSVRFTFRLDIKKHVVPIAFMLSTVIAQTIYVNSDMTILGLIKGDYEVGLYSTSVKIYNIINMVVASIGVVVMPQISESFKKSNFEKTNSLTNYALNFIVALGIPALICMNLFAEPILEIVGGKEYLGAAASLHILSLSLLFSFIGGWIGNTMMFPFGKEKICFVQSAFSALVNIVLNLILIPKFGLNAAAFTTFISELVGVLILVWFIDKRVKIYGSVKMMRAPLIGSLVGTLAVVCFKRFLGTSFVVSLAAMLLFAVLYVLTLVLFKDEFFFSFVHFKKQTKDL